MSLTPDVIRMRRHGRALGTRALGEKIAQEIRDATHETPALILDFSDVRVASSPFLDEVVCAMRAAIADRPQRFVLLANLNEDVADTIALVLERREASLTTLEDDKLEVLGGRPHLQETLNAAQTLGTFTAVELAERLEQKLPNLHQRLAQLQAAGTLTRSDDPDARRGRRLLFKTPELQELDAALC
jgi:DNA-binding MarR family transcriptional regulator